MITDLNRRAFLLGNADSMTSREVEVAILHDCEELDRIQCLEDELIDEFVFGRLDKQESQLFENHFLCTPNRQDKLNLAKALTHLAKLGSADLWRTEPRRTPFTAMIWRAVGLAAICSLLVLTAWLATSNARLRSQVAVARSTQQTPSTSPAQIKQSPSKPEQSPSAPQQPAGQDSQSRSGGLASSVAEATLAPGLTRSVKAAQIVRISPQTTLVLVRLEVLNLPGTNSREQLLDADGQCIWRQEFPKQTQMVKEKTAVIGLPASILAPGDYTLRIESKNSLGEFEIVDSYAFRVTR